MRITLWESPGLSFFWLGVSCRQVRAKLILPVVLMVVFALTRWPGLMPWNFSAAYALMFCAGVYFPKRLAWCGFAVHHHARQCDVLLNWVLITRIMARRCSARKLIGNYFAYATLVWLGRRFTHKASFLSLLGGGVLGAILFYLITNTLSWLFNPFHNPEYTKTFIGWVIALTKGTTHYAFPIKMETWELFRNNLLSGGLFTGLFAGAMKLMEGMESAADKQAAAEEPEEQPEEAKA